MYKINYDDSITNENGVMVGCILGRPHYKNPVQDTIWKVFLLEISTNKQIFESEHLKDVEIFVRNYK